MLIFLVEGSSPPRAPHTLQNAQLVVWELVQQMTQKAVEGVLDPIAVPHASPASAPHTLNTRQAGKKKCPVSMEMCYTVKLLLLTMRARRMK